MEKYNVLSLDGGGVKGLIQIEYLILLENILEKKGKKLTDVFNLIVGTSVGSIIGSMLSYGITAKSIKKFFLENISNIFKISYFRIPKYSKENLRESFVKNVGNPLMKDLKINFLCTSINVCEDKTHYFKSWESKDGELPVIEVILKATSAPFYFGKYINDSSVWIDGGAGTVNNPALVAYTECCRQNIFKDFDVNLLSLGTGNSLKGESFESVKKWNFIKEILWYIDLPNGGRARSLLNSQINDTLESMEYLHKNFNFIRLDTKLPDYLDKIDYTENFQIYLDHGYQMFNSDESKKFLYLI